MNPPDEADAERMLPRWVGPAAAGALAGALVTWGLPPRSSAWPSYAELFERGAPAVVNVTVDGEPGALGSGFAISPTEVITARHLVVAGDAVMVRGVDGRRHAARVVGTDARTDLALLQVQGAELPGVRLSGRGAVLVGETLVTVGNPQGFGHSLVVGTVGSLGHRLAPDAGGPQVGFLQLSMPLNRGNSGGPLFDEQGDVVGIVAGSHATGQSISFAVPVMALHDVLDQLRAGRHTGGAFLGAFTRVADQELVVHTVVPSSPADFGGIRPGDRIVAFDGDPVSTPQGLGDALWRRSRGDSVPVTITRDGVEEDRPVTLQDWARQAVVIGGMTLRPSSGNGGEVVAVRPGSRAERAGIEVGDQLTVVDGRPVRTPVDLQERLSGGQRAELEVLRGGRVVRLRLAARG